jgi:hypothetical protein
MDSHMVAAHGSATNMDGEIGPNWDATFWLDLKTNLIARRGAMYSFVLQGYSYGRGQVIHSVASGYQYSAWECNGQNHEVDLAPGLAVGQYCDPTDDRLVISLHTNAYLNYFSVSYIGSGGYDNYLSEELGGPKILGVFSFGKAQDGDVTAAASRCGDPTNTGAQYTFYDCSVP